MCAREFLENLPQTLRPLTPHRKYGPPFPRYLWIGKPLNMFASSMPHYAITKKIFYFIAAQGFGGIGIVPVCKTPQKLRKFLRIPSLAIIRLVQKFAPPRTP